jgi:hypothetical protein
MGKVIIDNPGFVSGSPRKRPEGRKGGPILRKELRFRLTPRLFSPKRAKEKLYRTTRKTRLYFHREKLGMLFFTFRRARSSSPSFLNGARRQSLASSGQVTFWRRVSQRPSAACDYSHSDR